MPSAASGMLHNTAAAGAEAVVFRQARDLSATISTGFRYIRDHWRTLYRPLFFICLPVMTIGSMFLGSFFDDFRPGRMPRAGSFLSMLGGYALLVLAYVLSSVIICEYMRWTMVRPEKRPTLREVWNEARRHVWAYLGISFLTTLITGTSTFLFVFPAAAMALISPFLAILLPLIPFCFFMTVFQFSYPLHAFERAHFGSCIGRAFSLVWGRWWMTFAMWVLLFGMSLLLNVTISLPSWLITGFGSLSGIEEFDDPEGTGRRLKWFFTLFSLIGNASALLIAPFVQVPMCFHQLSTLEKKEAPGLLEEVERFTLDVKAR
jgi:hypothetical protein